MSTLKNFKVIDFTHRLPGPLAGKIFSDLGASVYKVEDESFKDPFIKGFFNQSDSQFKTWYNELNQNKNLVRFDFSSSAALEQMHNLLTDADLLLLAQPKKILDLFKLHQEELKNKYPKLTVMSLIAGEGKFRNLHDLNALAIAGLLDMHIEGNKDKVIAPPFLPIAGISFGHWVVTKALAAIVSKKRWNFASLEEATNNILYPFRSQSQNPKFLHNGKFPCYCLYSTKDCKTLAIAAVEEKFWLRFTELFELNIPLEERFNTGDKVFNQISEKVSSMNSIEISSLIENEDICLSLI